MVGYHLLSHQQTNPTTKVGWDTCTKQIGMNERISQFSLLGVSINLIHPQNTMFDPGGFGNLNL